MIEILQTGRFNSLQDLGRSGYRNIGVSSCGAMDQVALKAGNLLIGNKVNAAAVEIQTFPFKILFHSLAVFSLTGAIGKITLGSSRLSAWSATTAKPGSILTIDPPPHGSRIYLCVAGGFDVPEILGSRSTSFRGSFGGLGGRELRAGDQLVAGQQEAYPLARSIVVPSPENCLREIFSPLSDNVLTVRALGASEETLFENSLKSFWQQDWQITPQSDRTGYRLTGIALQAENHLEMRSYGVVAGIVQVPPSGEPIIQMSDTNTAGGYPKIAGVISADLWRLGQLRPGQKVRFLKSDYTQAALIEKSLQGYFDGIQQMRRRLEVKYKGELTDVH